MPSGEFYVCATGSIEYGEFYEIDNAYCKYQYHFGGEWNIIAGIEEGLSQMCKCSNDARRLAVWNFPLDVTFKASNLSEWPQMILSIYGIDFFGHDIVRGYGVCRLPLISGRHEKKISIYAPESSSKLQQFAAWLTGKRPELIESSILASGTGRELTRMKCQGTVTVTYNIILKDLHKLGYENGEKGGTSEIVNSI